VSGGEVAAGVVGQGPPVVLVHGTPAWSYLWRGVVPLLAREHTVYVWDLLGFAYRTMPADVFGDLVAARFCTATHRPVSPDVAAAYVAPWSGPEGQQRWMNQVTAVSFEDTREVMGRLSEITAPTLVLWGDKDQWLDLTTADRLTEAIPGAVQETLPGAGHFAAEDSPRGVADALLRFLA
jgi:pimeloyl-ACP methyl ester carboxylesterase